MTRPSALHDPRVRLALGALGVGTTATILDRDRVGPREANVFHAVNDLPDGLYVPAWLVMQLGTVGMAPAAAAIAYATGHRRLAVRVLVAGVATWGLSKVVKRRIRRPRPAYLLPDARCRGREASGFGYLSGHAGVAVALGVAAYPYLSRRSRLLTGAVVPVVGLTRIYVGAHLPLDVAGGAALGLAVDAAVALRQNGGSGGNGPNGYST